MRNRRLSTLHIVNTSIMVKDFDVFCPAAGVPYEKETRPSMMMHWLFGPGRNLHLKHAHECVFVQNLVTLRCYLHRVEAFGKTGLVLRIELQRTAHKRDDRNGGYSREKKASPRRRECSVWLHGPEDSESRPRDSKLILDTSLNILFPAFSGSSSTSVARHVD
jgi:hypothetical protein